MILPLPAVCACDNMRRAAMGILAAVTGFTLAHALTVTAAMTDVLRPPSVIIESMIAFSIVVAAIDNIRPFIPAPRTAVAAFFGLFRGFGFPSALNLSGASFVTILPLLYFAKAGRMVLMSTSLFGIAVGGFWLFERVSPAFAYARLT